MGQCAGRMYRPVISPSSLWGVTRLPNNQTQSLPVDSGENPALIFKFFSSYDAFDEATTAQFLCRPVFKTRKYLATWLVVRLKYPMHFIKSKI